jgi:hypothetical protein
MVMQDSISFIPGLRSFALIQNYFFEIILSFVTASVIESIVKQFKNRIKVKYKQNNEMQTSVKLQ